MVIGRRDLDHIHPGEIDGAKPPQDRLRLPGRKAANLRRAGAWRKSRIQRIDIERQIRL